jgi:hypothetical protein
MAVVKYDIDIDMGGVGKLIRAVHNPVTSDPGSPADGEFWYRTDTDQFRGRRNGVTDSFAMMGDVTAGGVSASLWDAQSVVVAVTDNTPVAQTLAASTVLGRRSTGDITAISFTNLKTDLAITKSDVGLANVPNTDATLRSNHTGTQTASTISDFAAAADARITAFVGAAPTALDTLDELAAALGDDANFSATVTTALGTKAKGFAANIGNGTTTQTVTHGLGTTDVTVEVFVIATGVTEIVQVTRTDANNVKIDWNSTPASNTRRLVVIAKF